MLNEEKNRIMMNKIKFVLILLLFSGIVISQELSFNLQKSISEFDVENYDTALFYASKVNKTNIVKSAVQIKAKCYFELKDYDKALPEFLKLTGEYEKENSIYLAKLYALKKDWKNTDKYLRIHLKSEYKLNPGLLKTDKIFEEFRTTELWQEIWMKDWYSKLDEKIAEVQYLAYKKKYVDALDASDEILNTKKDCYKIYDARAYIYRKLKDVDNVVYSMKNAVKYAPNNAKYSFNYAQSLFVVGKYKKAIQELNRTYKLDNYYPRINYFFALYNFRNNNYEEAKKAIEKYRKIMPVDGDAIWLAGYIYKELNEYDNAVEVFTIGIKSKDQRASFYIGKGESLYNLQKYAEAISTFTMALDLDPRNPSIYYMRGLSSIELDRKSDACRDWQKASKMGFFKADDMISINCQQ